MVYCAGKLIENVKLFYNGNRPHYLWVYRRDNPLSAEIQEIRTLLLSENRKFLPALD